MKKTVKIISAVCAIVMLLGMLPIMSVSAADAATLVVTPSREAVKAGREFTVTVALANNPGLWTLKFELTYDANAFEYVKPDANDEAAVKAEAPTDVFDAVCFIGADTAGVISYNRGYSNPEANTSKNGALAVFTFRAKEDATLTGYTFTATVDAINTINVDSQPVAVAGASATAAVVPNVAVSTIDSAMVRLGGDIAVNYFVTLDEDHVGAQMRFTFGDEETVVDGEATGYANEYVYIFTGIAPQAMGDNLKAELLFGGRLVHYNELPGLGVAAAGAETACLHDFQQIFPGNVFLLIGAAAFASLHHGQKIHRRILRSFLCIYSPSREMAQVMKMGMVMIISSVPCTSVRAANSGLQSYS